MKKNKYIKDWEEFAQIDPEWAIMTDSSRKYNKWNKADFYDTGINEVEHLVKRFNDLKISIEHGEALDFGCGTGRLTRALSKHFKITYGLDISAKMIELARKHNDDIENINFIQSNNENLTIFESNKFHFVLSLITLQHNPDTEAIKKTIVEFLRILVPGGILYSQLPSKRFYPLIKEFLLKARGGLYHFMVYLGLSKEFCYKKLKLMPFMSMNHITKEEILRLIAPYGTVIDISGDHYDTAYLIRKN